MVTRMQVMLYSPRRSFIPRLARWITQYTRKRIKGCTCRESGGVSVYPGGVRVYDPKKKYAKFTSIQRGFEARRAEPSRLEYHQFEANRGSLRGLNIINPRPIGDRLTTREAFDTVHLRDASYPRFHIVRLRFHVRVVQGRLGDFVS